MAADSPAVPAIDIARLRVAYGDFLVLSDVSLRVEQGEVAVVVGGSGCGKSTLLKAAIGLVEPSSGEVRLLGSELRSLEESRQDALRKRIGVMFQYGALLNSLTIGENVALPLEMHTDLDPGLVREVVSTRLHLVGIGQAIDRYPSELSGGMRKRAALARAMALEPDILFCDEPGAGLDPVTAAEVDRLLLTVNRSLGVTLVVVTHELLSIDRLGGRLLMLAGGEVLFSGPSEEARRSGRPELAEFFHPQ
ncbi:MAG: ATP-binding cassette domain-containing protein [Gemmatimonadetes bacterium]|nr:ATP-binding cassette domain-containing protein [Gemmatimonadota bacterium]